MRTGDRVLLWRAVPPRKGLVENVTKDLVEVRDDHTGLSFLYPRADLRVVGLGFMPHLKLHPILPEYVFDKQKAQCEVCVGMVMTGEALRCTKDSTAGKKGAHCIDERAPGGRCGPEARLFVARRL
jgi:hypothetical protein